MRILVTLWALLATASPTAAKDISSETLAVLHDLMAHYRNTRDLGGDERSKAILSALDAMKKANLLDFVRPEVANLNISSRLGQALGLGRRTPNFLSELAMIYDALVKQDEAAVALEIQALYVKMGRAKPEGAALTPLVNSVRKAFGSAPAETDRTDIEGAGYTIVVENARAAGKANVSVLMTQGPGGRPARVSFAGKMTTRPDAKGTDLARHIAPASTPDVISGEEAEALEKRLQGKWRDKNGGEYEISIKGESVVVTHLNPSGLQPPQARIYRGTYRVGLIRARFEVTQAAELSAGIPAAVREQLARRNFGFDIKLEAKDKGAKLDGTWSSQHVTYSPGSGHKIEKVHSPYDLALELARSASEYRIVSLKIDYGPWEARQARIRSRIAVAKDDEQRLTASLTDALKVLDDRQSKAQRALANQGDAKRELLAAEAGLIEIVLPDDAKSETYRALERRRDRLKREVERLYNALVEASSTRNPLPPASFETHKVRLRELDALNTDLNKLATDAGIHALRQDARSASHQTFLNLVRSEGDFLAAVAVVESARENVDHLEAELLQARGKIADAEKELSLLASGMRRVGGTWVEESRRMKHETTIWEPRELLDFLSKEIGTLQGILNSAAEARRRTRNEFLSAREESIAVSDRLRNGIIASAAMQGLTEFGFSAWDTTEKFLELGPLGGIGEAAKKVAEAAILGPPSFYEPTLTHALLVAQTGVFPDVGPELENISKYLGKRAAKTYVSSPAASIVIRKFIETRSMKVYRQLIDEAITGSMETGYRIAGATQAERAMSAFQSLEKAQQGYRKALRESLFRNIGQSTRASLIETVKGAVKASINATSPEKPGKLQEAVYKDIAKMAAKTFFAEWLEGAPLADFIATDAKARLATQVFMAASGVYWQVRDDYEARVSEQREVLRQYDHKNSMRIIANEPFPENGMLKIILRDAEGQPLPSAERDIAVKVGGKAAVKDPGPTLVYSLEARDLTHDSKGGVGFEIIVSR